MCVSMHVVSHSYVGENPVLSRLGGPQIARVVRGAVGAMLWHSGYAAAAAKLARVLTPEGSALPPPFFVLETWRRYAIL